MLLLSSAVFCFLSHTPHVIFFDVQPTEAITLDSLGGAGLHYHRPSAVMQALLNESKPEGNLLSDPV
jgi:hypothetical protein